MIPGKVFFQSIFLKQQLSNRYQVYLLLNGIFYDKIKLFQTKYLCLTVNDLLEVQLNINNQHSLSSQYLQQNKQNNKNQNQPNSILKVTINHAYKLMIENKTIDIKYQLNDRNSHQQIKINLSFQPVSSFSRKKLGVNSPTNKNYNRTFQNISIMSNSHSGAGNVDKISVSSPNANDKYFPENLNFSRKRSPSSNNKKSIFIDQLEINSHHGQNRKMFNKTTGKMSMKGQNGRIEGDRVIEKQINYNRQTKDRSKDKLRQKNNKFTNIIESIQESSHINNLNEFAEQTYPNQIFTSRTHEQFINRQNFIEENQQQDSNEKYSEKDQENDSDQNEVNYKSGVHSEMDTLQSLAYQREKILGQLFGKFNKNTR